MRPKKALVLVVDDIQSNVDFLEDILASLDNLEIHGVNDGPSALKYIAQQKPDLILLDVSMPMMDGFEVCRKLKADEKYADIPIIFLTAKVQPDEVKQYYAMGALEVIYKPFDPLTLADSIKQIWKKATDEG